MDHLQAGYLQMFMSVTGASEVVALQKLQAHGGDLNAAINSFFNEDPVSQMQNENTNTADFMEEDGPLPRQNVIAPFPPFYPVPSVPASGARLPASRFGVEDMSGPPLSTRSTDPILLQPRDAREISTDWRDEEEPRVRPHTDPLMEEIPEIEASQFPSQSHGHITIYDEDGPNTASSRLREGGEAAGRALFGSNTDTSSSNTNLEAPLIDEVPSMVNNEGKDIEEEMLRAAIAASRKEAEAIIRMRPDYSESLSGAGAHEAVMHTEDADLARAVSLSLKTAEEEKALRESGKYLEEGFVQEETDHETPYGGKVRDNLKRFGSTSTADNSRTDTEPLLTLPADDFNLKQSTDLLNAAPSSPVEEVDELEEQPLLRRRSGRQLGSPSTPPAEGSAVSQQESPGTRQESSNAAIVAADGFHHSASLQGNANVFNNDEWGGISSEEQEEAVMLEAAMFGSLPEEAALRFRYSSMSGLVGDSTGPIDDTITNDFARPIPQPPSPTVIAQRRLREEQDDEYLASLEADREKEIKAQIEAEARRLKEAEAKAAAYAEEKLREEEELCKKLAEEEFRRQVAAKRAALPEEPSVDDDAAVTLLVRMPDGSRQGRRFRKSEILQCLFDFIDVSGGVLPGSYRLVRQYPRQAFTDAEHGQSFNDLGLTSRHEVFFLELI